MWYTAEHFTLSLMQKKWLTSQASLTKLLTEVADGDFAIDLQYEFFSSAIDELINGSVLATLNGSFFIRETILTGHKNPWVYARTAIPKKTLAAQYAALSQLGNSSLGNYLFSQTSLHRMTPEIAYLDKNNLLYRRASEAIQQSNLPNLWARRSIFTVDEMPLLVSETFLPGFWKEVE